MKEDMVLMDDKKQDRIFSLKQGLFGKDEGQDNDIGLCVHKGIFYIAVKIQDEWHFSQTLKAKDL